MTPQEALDILKVQNEPLYTVLKDILDKQERIEHSQVKVLEGFLIQHLDPTKLDLSWIKEYLNNSE